MLMTKGKEDAGGGPIKPLETGTITGNHKDLAVTIQKINSHVAQVYQQQKASEPNQVSRTDGKSSSGSGIPAATDSVQLSRKSQEIDQLQKAAAASGQIRSENVAQVQNQIQSNSYTIQPDKIADKMLQEHM